MKFQEDASSLVRSIVCYCTVVVVMLGPLPLSAGQCEVSPQQIVIPLFPELARRGAFDGTVACDVAIAEAGRIKAITDISGPDLLRDSDKIALNGWLYLAGEARRANLEFIFQLSRPEEKFEIGSKVIPPSEVHIFARRSPRQIAH